MKTVIYLSPSDLKFNNVKQSILSSTPRNYDNIKSNIEKLGIIEPLIVDKETYIVISGNVRLKISIELGLSEVPVIFSDTPFDMVISLSSDITREKTLEERYLIHQFMANHLQIKQGQRSDLYPEKKENIQILVENSPLTKSERNKVNRLKKHYGEEKIKEIIKDIDNGSTTFNKVLQGINKTEVKKVDVITLKTERVVKLSSLFEDDSKDRVNQLTKDGSVIVLHDSTRGYLDFYTRVRELKLEIFYRYVDRNGVLFYHLIFKGSGVLPDIEVGEIQEIEDVIRWLDYPEKMVA
ncbi:MAG: hypothetical protein FJX80_10015 [Bacteroidetes bacterium]|nr:hypothetical protein [Bacteroidota bacterium]